MEVAEIRDADSLRAWLEALPQETEAEREEAKRWAVAIAHRAAMRVLPEFWAWGLSVEARKRDVRCDMVFRCNLISGVAAVSPTLAIAHIADGAPFTAYSAATSANSASAATAAGIALAFGYAVASAAVFAFADAAADAAHASAAASEGITGDTWVSIRVDCVALQRGEALDRSPLWQDGNPLAQLWADTRPQILAQGEGWQFWVDWYENALHGRPQDWDLLTKVALIPPEDWDKGADHVNARIAEIVTERDGRGPKATPPPKAATVQRLKAAVEMNGPVLALQLRALQEVAAQEAERIRGVNSLDPEARAGLLEALGKLRDAAEEILRLLPDTGAPSDAEAEQILGWGEVLKSSARQWNEEAKRFVARKPDRETVAFAGRLVLAAAVAGPLSLMGAAPFAAVAGGAILLGGRLDVPKVFKSLRSGNPPT